MIRITEAERKEIQKECPTNRLVATSKGKSSGGRTYYIMGTDKTSLRALAKLRGVTVAQLYEEDKNLGY